MDELNKPFENPPESRPCSKDSEPLDVNCWPQANIPTMMDMDSMSNRQPAYGRRSNVNTPGLYMQ